jgi:cytochrome c oxidase cbb3-type subunit I/II
METFTYDDKIVRMFLTATIVWGFVGMLVGLILAIQLGAPYLGSYQTASGARPLAWLSFLYEYQWINFGRLRPLHTNAVIFAFAGNAIFTGVYYSTQRLCKARMWSDKLSKLHFWGWQGIIVAAALTLPFGITQGKEYAELEWPIDLAIAVVWLGFFGTNFIMTLVKRRERHMYVALWFYIASLVTVTVLHVFNNLSLPYALAQVMSGSVPTKEGFIKSWPVYAGVQDAFMQWWYGHNAVAFFLTTPFLGLMYYFMPKAAERPVYSYRLSIVHFWSLVFMYIWAGPHHLHYTSLPAWASTLGMVFSIMLWMPSWGGMINGLLTLRGAWHKVTKDPILKFFVIGVTFYGMATFEGPMMSIKSINALTHYGDWTIGHVHGGALGWNGFLTFGMMYWLLPRLFQTKLWSEKLMGWHFWIATIGMVMYILAMYGSGLTQGFMWRAFDEVGELQYTDFVDTVNAIVPFYWIRAIGGSLYLAGVVMAGVNLFMTWRSRPVTYAEPVMSAPALSPVYDDGAPAPSRVGEMNLPIGRTADVFVQGWWHRVWERKPIKFTVMTLLAVVVASLFEMIPTFLIKSNVPTIASVKPYTPLELVGRDIYIAEGCYNCHSQMIRPIWAETKRYGEFSKPGETVYDHPFQFGSRRIGPDLAREGGLRNHYWHVAHLENPRNVIPQSIMPSYSHLLREKLDFSLAQTKVKAHAMLGVPYGAALEHGEALAKAQAEKIAKELESQGGYGDMGDKQVIALVAYLQRIGVDLNKPADWNPYEGFDQVLRDAGADKSGKVAAGGSTNGVSMPKQEGAAE